MDSLKQRFLEAGLTLEMANTPFARGTNAEDVFGMDIQRALRGNHRGEWFRIWRGHKDNRIEVQGIDRKLNQLVLLVHEPPREFEMEVPYGTVSHQKQRHGENWLTELAREHRVSTRELRVQERRGSVRVFMARKTPSVKRHFLLGRDERQLFIAQLPKAVSTVKQAHDCLKSGEVTLAEGRVAGKTTRQGEYFFLNLTPVEESHLEEALRAKRLFVERKLPIAVAMTPHRRTNKQFGGNPHVADEVVVISAAALPHGYPVQGRHDVYVRGAVRHVDHATVRFKEWRKVIRNAERNDGRADGVHWVD